MRAEANNLTLVRLVLASAVIYTHCYWLLSGRTGEDDLSFLMGAPVSAYAVDGFFFLSGFLVYASLQRSAGVADFLLARLVRLWPALALSVGITVLAGYTFTVDRADYFSGATVKFLANNLSLIAPAYNLTGVLCDGGPCTINGSLWTLPWEARCYLLLGGLALLGLAREKMMVRLVLPVTLIGAILWDFAAMRDAAGGLIGRDALYYPDMADRLWPLFALGAAAHIFREKIRLSWMALGLLFIINLLAHQAGIGLHVRAVFVGYALLCFGFLTARWRAVSGRWHDYSYGMYIYAFPVMIALGEWREWGSHLTLAVVTALATLPFAILSWHLVERPALDWFRQYRKRRAAEAPALHSAA
jgi:peptidoglycan/LPS O-acetylase OafA/YrhL